MTEEGFEVFVEAGLYSLSLASGQSSEEITERLCWEMGLRLHNRFVGQKVSLTIKGMGGEDSFRWVVCPRPGSTDLGMRVGKEIGLMLRECIEAATHPPVCMGDA